MTRRIPTISDGLDLIFFGRAELSGARPHHPVTHTWRPDGKRRWADLSTPRRRNRIFPENLS